VPGAPPAGGSAPGAGTPSAAGSSAKSAADLVNRLQPLERRLGFAASAAAAALTLYFFVLELRARHASAPSTTAKETVHSDPWLFLVAGLLGSSLILLGTLWSRRALLAFAVFLVGLEFGLDILGLPFIALGLWLIFRVMRQANAARAAAPASARAGRGLGGRGAETSPGAGSGRRRGRDGGSAVAGPRRATTPSKRYTPPRRRPRPGVATGSGVGSGANAEGTSRRWGLRRTARSDA